MSSSSTTSKRQAWRASFHTRRQGKQKLPRDYVETRFQRKKRSASHPLSSACYGCLLEFLLTNKGLVVGSRDYEEEESNYDTEMMMRKYARQKRFFMEIVRWGLACQKDSNLAQRPIYYMLPKVAAGLYSVCLGRIRDLRLDVKKVRRLSENYELTISKRINRQLDVNYFDLRAAVKPSNDDEDDNDDGKGEQDGEQEKKDIVPDGEVGLFILQNKDINNLFNDDNDNDHKDDDDKYYDDDENSSSSSFLD